MSELGVWTDEVREEAGEAERVRAEGALERGPAAQTSRAGKE